jgi:NAD+ kinase
LFKPAKLLGGKPLKYNVIDRGDETSQQLAERFHSLVTQGGMIRDEKTPDIVLSIGGDGTMLRAFHQYIDQLDRIAFVGIHTGRLGFFADWKPDEVDLLAECMKQARSPESLRLVKYPLVEIEITTEEGIETHLALNEFTLKGIEETLVAQLDINDEMFEMFRGDGICISTPSGSTAYNKSLGGAMVHPALEAIQIAEIASINNRVYRTLGSSIILPKHHHCDIYPKTNQHMLLSLDHLYIQRSDVISIRCRVAANEKVSFARFRPFPFWNRVREAFIGFDVK